MLATHSKGMTRVWQLSESVPSKPWVHLTSLGTTKLGSVCRQYAWSPNGSQILTRWDAMTSARTVVCAPDPLPSHSLGQHGAKSVVNFSEKWPSDGCTRWLDDGGYISSYGGSIRRLDSTGREQNVFNLQHMSLIHDMEVTAGGSRVVAVGETLLRLDRRAVAESAILREPLTLGSSTTTDLPMECITWIPVTLRRECLEVQLFVADSGSQNFPIV